MTDVVVDAGTKTVSAAQFYRRILQAHWLAEAGAALVTERAQEEAYERASYLLEDVARLIWPLLSPEEQRQNWGDGP